MGIKVSSFFYLLSSTSTQPCRCGVNKTKKKDRLGRLHFTGFRHRTRSKRLSHFRHYNKNKTLDFIPNAIDHRSIIFVWFCLFVFFTGIQEYFPGSEQCGLGRSGGGVGGGGCGAAAPGRGAGAASSGGRHSAAENRPPFLAWAITLVWRWWCSKTHHRHHPTTTTTTTTAAAATTHTPTHTAAPRHLLFHRLLPFCEFDPMRIRSRDAL